MPDRKARVLCQDLGIALLDARLHRVPVLAVAARSGQVALEAARDVRDHTDVGEAAPLAVADDVDPRRLLERDRERHGLIEQALPFAFVHATLMELVEKLLQELRPRHRADDRGWKQGGYHARILRHSPRCQGPPPPSGRVQTSLVQVTGPKQPSPPPGVAAQQG
jgi:hypothetical protein